MKSQAEPCTFCRPSSIRRSQNVNARYSEGAWLASRSLDASGGVRLRVGCAAGYGGQPSPKIARGAGSGQGLPAGVSPEGRAKAGEPPRNRTENPQIKSLLLCQLS